MARELFRAFDESGQNTTEFLVYQEETIGDVNKIKDIIDETLQEEETIKGPIRNSGDETFTTFNQAEHEKRAGTVVGALDIAYKKILQLEKLAENRNAYTDTLAARLSELEGRTNKDLALLRSQYHVLTAQLKEEANIDNANGTFTIKVAPNVPCVYEERVTYYQRVTSFVKKFSTQWHTTRGGDGRTDLSEDIPQWIKQTTEYLPRHLRISVVLANVDIDLPGWNNLEDDATADDLDIQNQLQMPDAIAILDIGPDWNINKSIQTYTTEYLKADNRQFFIDLVITATLLALTLLTGQLEGTVAVLATSSVALASNMYKKDKLEREMKNAAEQKQVPTGTFLLLENSIDEFKIENVSRQVKPRRGAPKGQLGSGLRMNVVKKLGSIEGKPTNFVNTIDGVVGGEKWRFKTVTTDMRVGHIPWDRSAIKELMNPKYLEDGKAKYIFSTAAAHPVGYNGTDTIDNWNVMIVNNRPYAFFSGNDFVYRLNQVEENTDY